MEIQISRDIRKFKTKDIGNFSFKEAGFIAAGLAVGFLVYRLSGSLELTIPFMCVILVMGFFKPYGMSVSQFLRTVGKEKLTTQCYINETDFEYDCTEFKDLYGDEIGAHYANVIPAGINVNQTSTPAKINKQDRQRIIP